MKKSNVLKSTLIAVACSAAPFASQAAVMADAEIAVSNLALTFFDDTGSVLIPGQDVNLGDVSISFVGTSVSSVLNGVDEGESYDPKSQNPLAPLDVNLFAAVANSASYAESSASIDGNLLAGGANGNTQTTVSVFGNDAGDANSQIVNSLETSLTFDVLSDVDINLSFDWMIDTFVEIFDLGGEGNATWGLTVSLEQSGCLGFGCSKLIDFNLVDDALGGISSSGTLNQIGQIWDGEMDGSFNSGLLSLSEGVYTINISQFTSAAAVSVPTPTPLAIMGLGLIAVFAAGRRKVR